MNNSFKLIFDLLLSLVVFMLRAAWLGFKYLLITIFFFAKKDGNDPALGVAGQQALKKDFKNIGKGLKVSFKKMGGIFKDLVNDPNSTSTKVKSKLKKIKSKTKIKTPEK
ncbi:MAG: hypothetical protein ACR2NY_06610 [Alphaproteobacteria bacterium]